MTLGDSHFKVYQPGNFDPVNHFYTKVLNAQIHPMVAYFFNMDLNRIISRYLHLHPNINEPDLREVLTYKPNYLQWAGADLFKVTNEKGHYQMVLVETNSCPSGQKSMPSVQEMDEKWGYDTLLKKAFLPLMKERNLPKGKMAVIYDKNLMEASGYAAALADILQEPVYLIYLPHHQACGHVRFEDGVMQIFDKKWVPIRCAFRYVTQKPWNRIPISTKTRILNPIVGCLAGGRNKLMAAKAYDLFNAGFGGSDLSINTPQTIWNVGKAEVPLWVRKWGGHAVVKIPYSNAGQGVFTITNAAELESFMQKDYGYEQFIVQSLIGNYKWSSSQGKEGKYYHVGTVPNRKQEIYVSDLRMMVCSSEEGFIPLAIYSRRSQIPLEQELRPEVKSWDMLGTNLSVKINEGEWESDTNRLLIMDRKDFNKIGMGLDDLIEAFIQTVCSVVAIDQLATQLFTKKGNFRKKMFYALNRDDELMKELVF